MSKIALGTAQFGLDYGISNTHGKTNENNVDKILQYAYNNGIDTIDTATQYGNAESVIGRCTDNNHNWKIVTKTPHFSGSCIDKVHSKQLIQYFNKSMSNLKKKNVYGLLMHSCDDLFKHNGNLLFDEMKAFKSAGMVEKIGVSIYSSDQIDRILDNYSIDLIQLPINIFDQRLIDDGSLAKLKKYNVEIHARSVFLQGLLLMPFENIHPWFNPIIGTLEEFHSEGKKRGMSPLQLSIGFVQSISEIDKIVIGVNTLRQLSEIINIIPTRINTTDLSNMSIRNTAFINPSNWKI
jgi:aryl-alcohol dehydrogenase-like predicted oxidoreductase